MKKFHFIWWGLCSQDWFESAKQAEGYANLAKVIATSLQVASLASGHEVCWCKNDQKNSFEALFKKYIGRIATGGPVTSVMICPITDVRGLGVTDTDFEQAKQWWDECDKNLESLNHYNALQRLRICYH